MVQDITRVKDSHLSVCRFHVSVCKLMSWIYRDCDPLIVGMTQVIIIGNEWPCDHDIKILLLVMSVDRGVNWVAQGSTF